MWEKGQYCDDFLNAEKRAFEVMAIEQKNKEHFQG